MAEMLTGDPNQIIKRKQALLTMLNQQNEPHALMNESIGAMGKDLASVFVGQKPTSNVQGDRALRGQQLMEIMSSEQDRGIAADDRTRTIDKEIYTETEKALSVYVNKAQLDNDVDEYIKQKGIDIHTMRPGDVTNIVRTVAIEKKYKLKPITIGATDRRIDPISGEVITEAAPQDTRTNPRKNIESMLLNEGLRKGSTEYMARYADEMQKWLQKTGGGTNVTVDMGRQDPIANIFFGKAGEYSKLREKADTSRTNLSIVEGSIELMKKQISTGRLQDWLVLPKQVLTDLGIKVAGLSDQEIMRAYSLRMTIPKVKELGTRPTDFDFRVTAQSMPGMDKDEVTNITLIARDFILNQAMIELEEYITEAVMGAKSRNVPETELGGVYVRTKREFQKQYKESYKNRFQAAINSMAIYHKPIDQLTLDEINILNKSFFDKDKVFEISKLWKKLDDQRRAAGGTTN